MVFANGLGMFKPWSDATLLYLAATLFMLFLLVTTIVPDSPKWLLSQNRRAEADHCSKLLHGVTLSHDDLAIQNPQTKAQISIWKVIFPCAGVLTSHATFLGITLTLMSLQQLTGINALIFFTESICADSGASNPALCAFSITLAQFVFSLVACFVTDHLPKKLVLEITGCIMALALFCFAVSLANEAKGYTSLYCILVFFFGFSFGWGPLPLVVAMELFPAQLRGAASASGLAVNWGLSYLTTQTFLPMTGSLGSSNVFAIYGLLCLVSSSYVAIFLPEPQGSTLPKSRLEAVIA
ncbi:Facilitated trehalose transporter Tret1 [Cichlidogyrus casuarinus]|uniref:Facilitated trehalose transporter Tret1 n=1 Tax=Cichlidogyrus casuarinus TaxID=1844966 RepID=A0ABD2QH31_9PLAT